MVHLLSFSLSGSHDLGPGILWVKCNMFITLSTSPTALEINGWHQPAQTWIGESTETTNKAGNGQMSEVGRDSKIIRWWKNRQVYGQADKRKRQAATQTHRETRDRVTISGCNSRCSHLQLTSPLSSYKQKKSSKASLPHVPSTESDGNCNSIHLPSGKSHKLWAKQWTATPHPLACLKRKGKAFQRSKGVYLIWHTHKVTK